MWLLPLFPLVARAAAFVYYRIRYDGPRVPATGPVLLVANHPNSLFDPVLVVAAARRPVRFLAKAPLFADAKVGRLVRAAGAIPVYRRADDPSLMERNVDAFRAVTEALGAGAAVGIFPEGLSHDAPSLAPLKTGAARIALAAGPLAGHAFPIIPIGLVFRRKDVFRSEAVVLTGAAVPWDDLRPRGAEDADTVHTLTRRITKAIRAVTLNLEQWADRPLVELAVRIWEVERHVLPESGERVARLARTTSVLAAVRREADTEGLALADDIAAHGRRLRRLGLRPADLVADVGLARGLRWSASRAPLIMPVAAAGAVTSWALFIVPYQLTGRIVGAMRPEPDQAASHKLLVGIPVYGAWIMALALGSWAMWGRTTAVVVALGAPLLGMIGLVIRERWRGAWKDARRFLLLRSRRSLVAQLAARQHELAGRLGRLVERYSVAGYL